MKKHRNSQKRIYFEDAVYFVTCKTEDNYPYFKEKIFCDLFVENLRVCKKIKGFVLYAWVLCLDHFHLLLRPSDEFNISEVMRSLKTNISCTVNRIISTEGAVTSPRLREIYQNKLDIFDYKNQFLQKYQNQNPCPIFQWQKSYYDHYIRNEKDFNYHWGYIENNPFKHGLPDDWAYVFTNPEYTDSIDDYL